MKKNNHILKIARKPNQAQFVFDLPNELLVIIFSYLEPRDLINLLQVSKSFRQTAFYLIFRSNAEGCSNLRRRLLLSNVDNLAASYNEEKLNQIAYDGKLEIIQIINTIRDPERERLANIIVDSLKDSINKGKFFNGRIFYNQVCFKTLSKKKITELIDWLLIAVRKNEGSMAEQKIWYTLVSLFLNMNKKQLFNAYNTMNDIASKVYYIMFSVFANKITLNPKFVSSITGSNTINDGVLGMTLVNSRFFRSDDDDTFFKGYDIIGKFAEDLIPRLTNSQIVSLTIMIMGSSRNIFKSDIAIDSNHDSKSDKLFKVKLKAATASLNTTDCTNLFNIAQPFLSENFQLLMFLENVYYNLPDTYKAQILVILESWLDRLYRINIPNILRIYNRICSPISLLYPAKNLLSVTRYITSSCEDVIKDYNEIQYWYMYYKGLISNNYLVKLQLKSKFDEYEKLLQNNDNSFLLGFNIVNLINLDLDISRERKFKIIDVILEHDFTLKLRNVPITALMGLLEDKATPRAISSKIANSLLARIISKRRLLISDRLLSILMCSISHPKLVKCFFLELINLFYNNSSSRLKAAKLLIFAISNFNCDRLLISDILSQLIKRQEPVNFFKYIVGSDDFPDHIKEEFLLELFNYKQAYANGFIAKIPFETKKRLADYYKVTFLRELSPIFRSYLTEFIYAIQPDRFFDRAFFVRIIEKIIRLDNRHELFTMPTEVLHLVKLLKFNISLSLHKKILGLLYRRIAHSRSSSSIFSIIEFYNSMPNSLDLYSASEIKTILAKVMYCIRENNRFLGKSWCEFFSKYSKYLDILTEEQEQKLLSRLIETSWKEDIANSDNYALNLLMQLINTKNERNYLAKVRAMLSVNGVPKNQIVGTSANEIVLSTVVEEKFKKHKPKAKMG